MITLLEIVLSLSIIGLVLVIVLLKANSLLLELVLSLQERIEKLESQPTVYSQAIASLDKRNGYLEKKLDDLRFEVRVLETDRNALLVKAHILEEQNQMLSNSLKALVKN